MLCEYLGEILRTRRCHFVIYAGDERSLFAGSQRKSH